MQKRFLPIRTLSVLFTLALVFNFVGQVINLPYLSAKTRAVGQVDNLPYNTATRRNLGLLFDKLRARKTVTVAFFGGTHAAALEAKTPYRTHVINWFKQQYPQARLNELNAAVSGTGIS